MYWVTWFDTKSTFCKSLTLKFYLGTGQEDIKALERGYEKVSFVIFVHYLKYSLFKSYIYIDERLSTCICFWITNFANN